MDKAAEKEQIMKELESEAATEATDGELYRIEFWAPHGGQLEFFSTNTSTRSNAENLLRKWRDQDPGLAIFCGTCPPAESVECPHLGIQPDAYAWRYPELDRLRIMPAREAL